MDFSNDILSFGKIADDSSLSLYIMEIDMGKEVKARIPQEEVLVWLPYPEYVSSELEGYVFVQYKKGGIGHGSYPFDFCNRPEDNPIIAWARMPKGYVDND